MSRRQALSRHNLIIKKLRKRPATFAKIAEYLDYESDLQGDNLNISIRTFQRDIREILSLYSIDIQYDKSRKVYYIDSDEQPEANERIFEAFDTLNALNLTSRLSDYIHFEKRKPRGTEHLHGLLHAIKNNLKISFFYHKFWEEEGSTRHIEPYALKEFKNRWYLLCKDADHQEIRSFALDRMSDLEISRTRFVFLDDFDINERFRYCFGIMSPNGHRPEEVVLSFDPFQGKYIKSLPLHDTQKILADNEQELRIGLKLFITHDFIMELLSLGANVKVLQPQSLIQQLKSSYQQALKGYG